MGYVDAFTDWVGDGLDSFRSDPRWVPGGGNAAYDSALDEISGAVGRGLPQGQADDWRNAVEQARLEGDVESALAIKETARAYDGTSFGRKDHNVTVIDVEADLNKAKNVVAGAVGLYVVGALVLLVLVMRR